MDDLVLAYEDHDRRLRNLDEMLADLEDPASVVSKAVSYVATALGDADVGLGERIEGAYVEDAIFRIAGISVGWTGSLHVGDTMRVDDAGWSPHGSRLLVRVEEAGRPAAILCIRSVAGPRAWHEDEHLFLVQAGRRIWSHYARRRAEAELARSGSLTGTETARNAASLLLFRNIVESATAPICAFDTEFRLIAFNEAHNDEFFRVNGFRTKIGDVFPDQFVPEQRPIMRALMAKALEGEPFVVTEEFGNPAIGTPCWELAYAPLRNAAGEIIGAFHYAQDISSRMRAETELASVQDALRQAHKMEAVGQLTGGLAHDFNNLLAGISGSLELIQTRIEQRRLMEVDRYIVAAQEASRRAAALTHRLLAFSRRQTLAPVATDPNRLVEGLEELLRRTVGPHIDLRLVLRDATWPILVDRNQLENAILNLCINSRDAMPDGGSIVIEIGNETLSAVQAARMDLKAGEYVVIGVGDDGSGMDKGVIEKAFDPFFTTKPIGVGTGLGLSMIYGFARQSGGQARIESAVGVGTVVSIHLPRHHVVEKEIAPEVPEGPAMAVSGETVLVIDDEPLVRMLIVDVLEDLGYIAIEAGDGPKGMDVVRSDARIDLLVTDVGLPNGMNGRQVADAAREIRPGLKVLFVTGYAESAVLDEGHLDPGMQVVTKPFDLKVLAARIESMIAG